MNLSSGTLGRAVLKRDPLSWLGLELGDGILELQRQAGADGETEVKRRGQMATLVRHVDHCVESTT